MPLKYAESQKAETIKKYGEFKRVRYLVNSTSDFWEVLATINNLVGKLGEIFEVESLQKLVTFNVIPLPDSTSKFITMFDVPAPILGDDREKDSILLDFSKYPEDCKYVEIFKHPAVYLYNYKVDSLFDVNLALYHFEKSLAADLPNTEFLRLSTTARIQVTPRSEENLPIDFLISREKNLA